MFCVNKYRNTRLITGFTYGIAASKYCCKFCRFGIAKFLLSVYFYQKVETAYSCRLENTKRNKLVLLCVFYGFQHLFTAGIKTCLRFLSFNGVIQDGRHISFSQLFYRFSTTFNGFSATELLLDGIAD